MARLLDDYKKTLKPRETEEYINIGLFRPAGFLLVLLVRRINFSPNYYTIVALICGLASGYCFAIGQLTAGAILLCTMITFDCADGQLARLKNAFSKTGKMLDVSADIISYSAMLLGLAYHHYQRFPLFLLIAIAAFLTLGLNTLFCDHFKNQWISFLHRSYGDKLDGLTTLSDQLKAKRGIAKVPMLVYYQGYRLENFITKIGSISVSKRYSTIVHASAQPSQEICDLYKEHFKQSVRMWSLIGTSTHFSIVAVLAFIKQVQLVFPVFIIYSLALCFLLIVYQNLRFRKFLTAVEKRGVIEPEGTKPAG